MPTNWPSALRETGLREVPVSIFRHRRRLVSTCFTKYKQTPTNDAMGLIDCKKKSGKMFKNKWGVATRILHADRLAGVEHYAVHKPLHTSSAYAYPSSDALIAVFQGAEPGFLYSRQGNPTTTGLEEKISLLENARKTLAFSTGMAAIAAVFLTLLKAGDHLLASKYLFGNTSSLLQTLQGLGIDVTLVDPTDAPQLASAVKPNTRAVFVETIANPGTQVAALKEIGEECERKGLLYIVDSTLTTPLLLQGKDVKACLVIHSLSKGMSGHGAALGGSVSDTGLFDWGTYPNIDPAYRKGNPSEWGMTQIRKKALRDMGATLRAEDAHRIALGLETLALRVAKASENANILAQWLASRPEIKSIKYPGLVSHPEHSRAAQLFNGLFGNLISIELQPELDWKRFLNGLRLIIQSTHLSDNRTLILPVAHTIFWEMGAERRQAAGIAPSQIRISVGIESVFDLQNDLAQALEDLKPTRRAAIYQ